MINRIKTLKTELAYYKMEMKRKLVAMQELNRRWTKEDIEDYNYYVDEIDELLAQIEIEQLKDVMRQP